MLNSFEEGGGEFRLLWLIFNFFSFLSTSKEKIIQFDNITGFTRNLSLVAYAVKCHGLVKLIKSSNFLCCCALQLFSGWPADLEFLETWKSQGILWHLQNVREKSGNFVKFRKIREF